jgi:hypothetical protein
MANDFSNAGIAALYEQVRAERIARERTAPKAARPTYSHGVGPNGPLCPRCDGAVILCNCILPTD